MLVRRRQKPMKIYNVGEEVTFKKGSVLTDLRDRLWKDPVRETQESV